MLRRKDSTTRPGHIPVSSLFDIRDDSPEGPYFSLPFAGDAVMRLPLINKGMAFTHEERVMLRLEGLLLPKVLTIEQQCARIAKTYRGLPTPFAKWCFLREVQERNEVLFHAVLAQHLEEMLPVIYMPTLREAVLASSSLPVISRALYFSARTATANALRVLRSFPLTDVRLVILTDGSSSEVGDVGITGVAIPIGKSSVYVQGGVSPFQVCPMAVDVGTDTPDLLEDRHYLGIRERRLTEEAYLEVMDRIVEAIEVQWPRAVIQWEGISRVSSCEVLHRYQHRLPSFNDRIQGLGAVFLAGVLRACAMMGVPLSSQRYAVVGEGVQMVGVIAALRHALAEEAAS
eukprot:RCo033576